MNYHNTISYGDAPDGSEGGYDAHGNYIIPAAMMEIVELREALQRLLACPAIADENFSDPEWGCAETREAEAFARAALAPPTD